MYVEFDVLSTPLLKENDSWGFEYSVVERE
jgi:hypothetical protein